MVRGPGRAGRFGAPAGRLVVDTGPLRTSPAFRRLWTGRLVSGFGTQMTAVAVMYQVWRGTGSTVWTGAVGLAEGLPLIVLGLPAGALADRVDRRRLNLVAVAGAAACSVLLAVQGLGPGGSGHRSGHLVVLGVLALVAVQAGFGAIGGPAAGAILPRLLPKESLPAAFALNRVTWQSQMLVGPALGGLLIGFAGVGGCYVLDALSFTAGFYGVLSLPPMPPRAAPDGEPRAVGGAVRAGLRDIAAGLAFVRRTADVRGALLTDLAATVLSMPMSLFPLVNAERFGGSPRTLGLFLSAVAVGGVLASVLSGTFTRLPRPGLVMLCGSTGWGLALVLFGLVTQPWLALGLLAVAGAFDTAAVIARSTVTRLRTPDAMQGRLGAAEQIVGQAGPQLGTMRAGLVAGATSGTVSLVSGGSLCVVAVALVAVTSPALRRTTLPGAAQAATPTPAHAAE